MKHFYQGVIVFALCASANLSQTNSSPVQTQPDSAVQTTANLNRRRTAEFSEYGAQIKPDERLIVVMAALAAAGFNPKANSAFHQTLRRDTANLDSDLRRRLHDFFARANKNLETATVTDQAARYVSLAYALGSAPDLTAPARSIDLPASLLEVLDFAPLVQEFYRKSGIAEKLPQYVRAYQEHGNKMRAGVAETFAETTSYLNTRPQLTATERVTTTNRDTAAKNNKKGTLKTTEIKTSERRFFVVPDLLAAANSVKFRQIAEDYFVIVGAEVEPQNSVEFRRAYLQFLIDPLIYKNVKEVSLHRDGIHNLLEERIKAGAQNVSPDPFLAVSRSLVAAAEIRDRKQQRIRRAEEIARAAIAAKQNINDGEAVVVDKRLTFPKAETDAFAELSEAYEAGAVLAFFFNEQLGALESSGFDVASAFADMIASFDQNKEQARFKDEAAKRKTAIAAYEERRKATNTAATTDEGSETNLKTTALLKDLSDVESMLKAKDYDTAENRLRDLLIKNPGEPRVLFALGRTASLSAEGAFDENLRNERLKKAATHYFNLLQIANKDTTSPALLSSTHVALARIYEFYADDDARYKDAALKQFEAAISLGEAASSTAYRDALIGKARLSRK